MSDRTHQYRLLTRRDPAITTQVYGVDPATGEAHPLASTADGKLVVEVSGGGGGGGQVIQGVDSGGTAHDILVETDGKLIVDVASAPVIKAEGPSGPLELGATVDARLTVQVQDDATVAMRAVGPSGITDVQMSADGLLVDVSPGVVIPVDSPTGLLVKGVDDAAVEHPLKVSTEGELQVGVVGVAEVKATSTNFWALSKGDGPVVVPDLTDADGWFDVQAFSRFSAAGMSKGYTWDKADGFIARAGTVHRATDWATLTAAITAASANDVILLQDGLYTMPSSTPLTIDKPLVLIGESKTGVIVQTTAAETAGLVTICSITSSDVTIASMTFRWQWFRATTSQEVCIAADNVAGSRYSNVHLENLRLEFIEEGIRGRFDESRIASCELVYVGRADTNDHRAIRLRSLSGQFELLDCVFNSPSANVGNLRCIWYDGTTGDTFAGRHIIARNSQADGSDVFQFFEMPGQNFVPPGPCHLEFRNNTVREQNGFVIFSSVNTNTMDFLTSITLENNSIANGTGELTGKGFVAIDAGSSGPQKTVRTTALPLYANGNTSVYADARADYTEFADILVVGRTASVAPFTVTLSTTVEPSIAPEETGGNVLLEDHISVDVDYRISMAEPHYHTLASGNLNSAYHQIQNPEQPADILGIGHLRLRGHASADRGGWFAVFGSCK